MATIETVIEKITDALNEAHLVAGTVNPTEQITALQNEISILQASLATVTSERDNAVSGLTSRQKAIDAMKAAALAEIAADASSEDGRAILNAAGEF